MTKSRGRLVVLAVSLAVFISAGCGGSDSPSTAEPVSSASAKNHPHIPVEGGTTVIETPGKP
jgi:hypothetical protein